MAVAVARRGEVEGGVAVEEAHRRHEEAGVLDGHHGPVLRAHEVGDAERVPEHDVGIDEVAVRRGPAGETVAALVLVRVLARGAALVSAPPVR